MADATRELQILISARDEASKVLSDVSGGLSSMKSRLEPVIGGLKEIGFVGLGAAAGLGALLTKAAFAGANLQRLDKTLEVVAKNTGISNKKLKEMKDTLAEVNTRGSAATETILTFAQTGLAAETDFKKFVSTTKDFAAAAGVSSDVAVKQFTQSIVRLQPELLSAYGIELNLNQVYGEAAAAIGKKVVEMTAEEKRQAFLNEIYRQGGNVLGVYAETYNTAGKNVLSLQDRFRELMEMIGSLLTPAFQEFTSLLNRELTKIVEWFRTHPEEVKKWGEQIRQIATQVIEIFKQIVIFLIQNKEIIIGVFVALGIGLAVLVGAFLVAHAVAIAVFAAIVIAVTLLLKAWNSNFLGIRTITETVFNWITKTAWPALKNTFEAIKSVVGSVAGFFIDKFNAIKGAVEAVIGAISRLIEAAQNLAKRAAGGLKIPGFQHGGYVPGSYSEAVPAILHGGERVIPRTGVDVNQAQSPSVSINISGNFNLDSQERVNELADRIIGILGRQNELAAKGLGV